LRLRGLWDGEAEARFVGEQIEDLQRRGHRLTEIAILVRTSAQTREFEERFITLGLPYRVVGGPRFYERLEVRDALAYLRVLDTPGHDLAFERILNKPKRGLGEATLRVLFHLARASEVPLFEAARRVIATDELRPAPRRALADLVACFERWRAMAGHVPHTQLAEIVFDESGYTAMWQNDKSADAPGRLENLRELVNAMAEFETLAGFLEHVALVMEINEGEGHDLVSLMTLHAAKGLEFDTVFLPGWEEGLFPNQRALDEHGVRALEEERRLAYVGLTRARSRAILSFAANRRLHGTWTPAIPSRFVDELPKEHVEVESDPGLYGAAASRPGFGFEPASPGGFAQSGATRWSPGMARARRRRARANSYLDASAEAVDSPPAGAFVRGARVFHQKFGYGTVAAVEGDRLDIEFDKAGKKKVIASFVVPGDRAG
ncbi:MAG: ATP-dependent helicase, partial [Kiloniellaceae bacterium]